MKDVWEASRDKGVRNKVRFTPLALCSLTFWLGSAASLTLLREVDASFFPLICALCFMAALVLALMRLPQIAKRMPELLPLAAAFCLLGVSLAAISAYDLMEGAELLHEVEYPLEYRLEEDLVSRNGEFSVLASVDLPSSGKRYVSLSFNEDPGLLLVGDIIRSSASLSEANVRSEYNWEKRICAEAVVYGFELVERTGLSEIIDTARRQAIESFGLRGGGQSGILQALICGYRGGIEATGEYEDYKIVGLAHIIAVSGSHLAIVAAFVQVLLMRMSVHARYRTIATIFMMGGYFVFTGSSISAFRSLFMVIVSLCAYFSNRRNSALNALSLCIITFVAIDPFCSLSVSFILSAGSTLGIIMFASLFIDAAATPFKALNALCVDPIALTLSSALTTQAYSAALFSQLPLASIVANVLIAPLFAVSCVLGLLAAMVSVFVPALSQVLVSLAAVSCVPMQMITGALSRIPYASVPFNGDPVVMIAVSAALSAALYLWWPNAKSLRICAAAIFVCLALFAGLRAIYVSNQDELIMLDVGQGDSFILRSSGASIMVDTGTNDALLKQALARNGVYRLEALVITHPDDDHCGSIPALSQIVRIESVYLHEDLLACSCDNCSQLIETVRGLESAPDIVPLSQGDIIELGGFRCEIVWPRAFASQGGNPDSLCILIDHLQYGWKTLMVGDAEEDEVEQILDSGVCSQVDVFKVGHHGSAQSVNEDLLDVLQPLICLLSVGEANTYGHPDDEVVRDLESSGALVLRSDVNGDVCLRYGEEQIRVLL